MAGDLDGKGTVVTGGGDGVGRECPLAMRATAAASLFWITSWTRRTDANLGAPNTCWGARPRGEVIANAAKFLLSSKARFVTDCICRFAGKVRLATVNHRRR
jgi:hypothetical protein